MCVCVCVCVDKIIEIFTYFNLNFITNNINNINNNSAREWGRVRSRGTAFLFFSSLGTIIGLVSIYSLFGRASDGIFFIFYFFILLLFLFFKISTKIKKNKNININNK